MKQPYNPPRLEVVIFAPWERLAQNEEEATLLDMDLEKLTEISRASGSKPAVSLEGDIFIPFW